VKASSETGVAKNSEKWRFSVNGYISEMIEKRHIVMMED